MTLLLSIAIAHCLIGLYLIASSREFRTTVWGPMPPLATMQMLLFTMTLRNGVDPDKAKPLPDWLGRLLGYLLLAITGIAALVCWPFVLKKQRRETRALRERLSESDRQRDAEITAAYTAPLQVEQDAKSFGELWTRHFGDELPKCIVVSTFTWDLLHIEGLSSSTFDFRLQDNTYVYIPRRGGNRVEIPTERMRAFIASLHAFPLIRKRPAHLDRSFEFSGQVTEIKVAFFNPGKQTFWLADTIEIETKHGETTCVHYVGSHTDNDNLRRKNPCWLVGGEVEQIITDFARSVSARLL